MIKFLIESRSRPARVTDVSINSGVWRVAYELNTRELCLSSSSGGIRVMSEFLCFFSSTSFYSSTKIVYRFTP